MQRTNRLCGRPLKWAPDESLLELSQRGDADAFVSLTTRHWDTVYRVARNMLVNRAEAAQVAEATFLAVRETPDAFPKGVPFTTSLYRMALGESWQRLQKAPEERVCAERGGAARIREVLQKLDRLDRAIFLLRQIEEVSLAETATILGIAPASIRERTHRATLLLAGVVGGGYEPANRSSSDFAAA